MQEGDTGLNYIQSLIKPSGWEAAAAALLSVQSYVCLDHVCIISIIIRD